MTDKQLLRMYQKAGLKSVAVIRAAEEEKVSLEEIVDRLEALGKHIRAAMRRAFNVSGIREITRADMNAYLKNNGYKPLDPDIPQAGVVSDYCEKCRYLNLTAGSHAAISQGRKSAGDARRGKAAPEGK